MGVIQPNGIGGVVSREKGSQVLNDSFALAMSATLIGAS